MNLFNVDKLQNLIGYMILLTWILIMCVCHLILNTTWLDLTFTLSICHGVIVLAALARAGQTNSATTLDSVPANLCRRQAILRGHGGAGYTRWRRRRRIGCSLSDLWPLDTGRRCKLKSHYASVVLRWLDLSLLSQFWRYHIACNLSDLICPEWEWKEMGMSFLG